MIHETQSKYKAAIEYHRKAKESLGSGRIALVRILSGEWVTFGTDAIKVSKILGVLRFSVRDNSDFVRCAMIEKNDIEESMRKIVQCGHAMTITMIPEEKQTDGQKESAGALRSRPD
jgi:hypothetical protein